MTTEVIGRLPQTVYRQNRGRQSAIILVKKGIGCPRLSDPSHQTLSSVHTSFTCLQVSFFRSHYSNTKRLSFYDFHAVNSIGFWLVPTTWNSRNWYKVQIPTPHGYTRSTETLSQIKRPNSLFPNNAYRNRHVETFLVPATVLENQNTIILKQRYLPLYLLGIARNFGLRVRRYGYNIH